MKKILLLMVAIATFSYSEAQILGTQNWSEKLTPVTDAADLYTEAPVALDSDGNTIATGTFTQSLTIGSTTLEPVATSAFLAKYNAAGEAQWAVALQGAATITAVTTDSNGNIYIGGKFADVVTVGSTDGNTQTITGDTENASQISAFVAKYDANGALLANRVILPEADADKLATGLYYPEIGINIKKIVAGSRNIFVSANYYGNINIDNVAWTGRYLDIFGFMYMDQSSMGIISFDTSLKNAESVLHVANTNEINEFQMGPEDINFVAKGTTVYAAVIGYGNLTITGKAGSQNVEFAYEEAAGNCEHGIVVAYASNYDLSTYIFNAPSNDLLAQYSIGAMELVGNNRIYLAGTFYGANAFNNELIATGECDIFAASISTTDFETQWVATSQYTETGDEILAGMIVKDETAFIASYDTENNTPLTYDITADGTMTAGTAELITSMAANDNSIATICNNGTNSTIALCSYATKNITVSAPEASVKGGVYGNKFTVQFTATVNGEASDNVKFYCTTDGSTPEINDTNNIYGGYYSVSGTVSLNVIAVYNENGNDYVSDVTTVSYIISEKKPFELATSVNDLKDGYILIAANDTVATSLKENYTYGYLFGHTNTFTNNITEDFVYYAYSLQTVEGGYAIKDQYGRYLYQKGTYNNFNVSATMPESGAVWNIEIAEDGTATITNVEKNKYIQYSTQYTSFGCYESEQSNAVMPKIYVAGEYPELNFTPDNSENRASLQEFTFTCDKGITIGNDSTGTAELVYIYFTNGNAVEVSHQLTATTVDANTIVLSTDQAHTTEGQYSLRISDGYFTLNPNGLNMQSENISVYYSVVNVSGDALAIVSTTPTMGSTVETLSEILVKFNVDVDINNNYATTKIYNTTADANGNYTEYSVTATLQDADGKYYSDASLVRFVIDGTIEANGTYSLVIPENLVYKYSDSSSYFAGENVKFTVNNPTAINTVKESEGTCVIYDLTGRKIDTITAPGVYIINGKKVIIK